MLNFLTRYRANKMILGVVLWMLPPFFVFGQILDPVDFHIKPESLPLYAEPGVPFTVTIQAAIDPGWHLYSILNRPEYGPIPTIFSSDIDKMIIAGDITESEAETAFDPNFNTVLGWHSDSVLFQIPLAVDAAPDTEFQIRLQVQYQVCDDISCLPPNTKTVHSKVSLSKLAETSSKIDLSAGDFGIGTGVNSRVMTDTYDAANDNRFLFIVIIVAAAGVSTGLILINRKKKRVRNGESG